MVTFLIGKQSYSEHVFNDTDIIKLKVKKDII